MSEITDNTLEFDDDSSAAPKATTSPTPELLEKLVDQYTDNLMRAALSMGF